MRTIPSFLLGAVAGAATAYISDPECGGQRRALAAAKARSLATRGRATVEGKLDHATDRAMGTIADALPDAKPENDQVLVSKIRSEVLGAQEWRAHTINVDAADGNVTIRGQVDRPEQRTALAKAVEGVTGVQQVENLLHLPGEPAPNTAAARRASRP